MLEARYDSETRQIVYLRTTHMPPTPVENVLSIEIDLTDPQKIGLKYCGLINLRLISGDHLRVRMGILDMSWLLRSYCWKLSHEL